MWSIIGDQLYSIEDRSSWEAWYLYMGICVKYVGSTVSVDYNERSKLRRKLI